MIVFLKKLYQIWVTERPVLLAAALAYYGMFSLAPIVYISLTIAGLFVDEEALANQLTIRAQELLGPEVVALWQDLMVELGKGMPADETGWLVVTSLISFLVLFWAASGIFYQIQFSMDTIWKVHIDPEIKKRSFIQQRLLSFLLVISVGFVMVFIALASLTISSLMALTRYDLLDPLLLGAAVIGLLWACFMLMYKFVPNIKIRWQDVWLGALVAAMLSTLGIWLLGLVLQLNVFRSALAAASSFTVFIVGIYYFAQIFLLGAVICRLYASMYGSRRNGSGELKSANKSA